MMDLFSRLTPGADSAPFWRVALSRRTVILSGLTASAAALVAPAAYATVSEPECLADLGA